MEALILGTLRAESSTGCLWLEGEGGEQLTQLLLQGDYRVDFSQDPAAVFDGDSVAARVGDRVDVAGGFTEPVDGVEGCPATAATWLGYLE